MEQKCIGGVMITVLASSAIDRGCEPQSSQTRDYETSICRFSTKQHAVVRAKTGWFEIRMMCPN